MRATCRPPTSRSDNSTLFRNESATYAIKLSDHSVPVEFHLHPGVPHEFDAIAFTADVSKRAITDRVRVLKSI